MDDNLDRLLRTTDNTNISSLEQSKKFANTKRRMNALCKALTLDTKIYNPQKTVENINSYIATPNKLDRMLYSEISYYVFSLEESKRGIITTNLEKLLLFSLDDDNNVDEDSKKIIIKFYDHFQLILHQIENANNIFDNSITEARDNLQKEVKNMEKEYISILGIFAAIILAFVSGITFSTSVLQNMSSVSMFRLLLTVDFLAFVLINVIHLLIKLIFMINERSGKAFDIKILNVTCLLIAIIVIVAWLFSADQIPNYISAFFPWSK